MTNTAESIEKIYRVWSERKEDQIAVRLQYTVSEIDECRIYSVLSREEWS